jgi:hypothetical protein
MRGEGMTKPVDVSRRRPTFTRYAHLGMQGVWT